MTFSLRRKRKCLPHQSSKEPSSTEYFPPGHFHFKSIFSSFIFPIIFKIFHFLYWKEVQLLSFALLPLGTWWVVASEH